MNSDSPLRDESNDAHGLHPNGYIRHSRVNKLASFHVCLGLAPCLGHDCNEGIIAYDLALYTQYFVKTKEWFTYMSMPKKVVGGAWQVWTFLRLYPLIVGDKIKNVEDPAWLAILKLIEIMEMITAPSIHSSCIGHLQCVINEYLYLRISSFPNVKLRPKHYYLSHYPKLLKEFGNLIKSRVELRIDRPSHSRHIRLTELELTDTRTFRMR
ncbi:Kappa-theraphotoxin-Cg1c [Frankliniella fusca]|uniref:Kappa-theraphotoxin-Cg1c n=1 Tax=Frankliniella fusca TaxID=407009 RepID=A0AAE1GXR6_9NEOP|nr:Kappa-theraphotoxin-Cg1c [Frankliniella fusca]